VDDAPFRGPATTSSTVAPCLGAIVGLGVVDRFARFDAPSSLATVPSSAVHRRRFEAAET
jgi:hypothetical protein